MNGDRLTLYHDGACPLCRKEIAYYLRADVAHRLDFVDVSRADADPGAGLDRARAMARFHVREADGALRSGADAFVAVWERLPGWHRAARIAYLPGMWMILEALYRLSRPLRPFLARIMRQPLPGAEADFAAARRRMVERDIAGRGIADARVLAVMGEVPRELFVSSELAAQAYADRPLPIGAGQTISQPYMVAAMLDAAAITPADRALEIGTGSGYAAALLAGLASDIHTIERDASLFTRARDLLRDYDVHVHLADGGKGWSARAPFDVILVAAAATAVPQALKDQLAVGGRLVAPVGDGFGQRLVRLTRLSPAEDREEDLGPVMFVPLTPGVRQAPLKR